MSTKAVAGLGAGGAWERRLRAFGVAAGVALEVVRCADEVRGFVVQKWQWIVERTIGWLAGFHRLSRCYERLAATDEAMVKVVMTRLMLRRLAHPKRETFRGTIAFAEAA